MSTLTPVPVEDQNRYWAMWAVLSAFGTYFCMYAFRKPFTSAGFEGTEFGGLPLKSLLVTSQILGYTISKFIGIKVISEMPTGRRAQTLLMLIAAAELSLILFAIVTPPWNAVFMFLNGIPLGMVFGLVLSFLEGRRITEALSAGLCASFILADGFTKSVGAWLLTQGISEFWMPSIAGAIFVLPLAGCVYMLAKTPAPTATDKHERSERVQMTREDRWLLMRRFGPGLLMLVLVYLMITILRSLRSDFAREIWIGLGEPAAPETFTTSEMLVALGVLAINGSLVFVRGNRKAFFISLATCALGLGFIAWALIGRTAASPLSAFQFMVLVGLGLYLPYVAMHTTIFERLLAITRERGNVGFLMYLADSIGYLGYVGCMLARGTLSQQHDLLSFFTKACWVTCVVSLLGIIFCGRYFGTHQTVRNVTQGSEPDLSEPDHSEPDHSEPDHSGDLNADPDTTNR